MPTDAPATAPEAPTTAGWCAPGGGQVHVAARKRAPAPGAARSAAATTSRRRTRGVSSVEEVPHARHRRCAPPARRTASQKGSATAICRLPAARAVQPTAAAAFLRGCVLGTFSAPTARTASLRGRAPGAPAMCDRAPRITVPAARLLLRVYFSG